MRKLLAFLVVFLISTPSFADTYLYVRRSDGKVIATSTPVPCTGYQGEADEIEVDFVPVLKPGEEFWYLNGSLIVRTADWYIEKRNKEIKEKEEIKQKLNLTDEDLEKLERVIR